MFISPNRLTLLQMQCAALQLSGKIWVWRHNVFAGQRSTLSDYLLPTALLSVTGSLPAPIAFFLIAFAFCRPCLSALPGYSPSLPRLRLTGVFP